MTDPLSRPAVPELPARRVAVRRDHLVTEITAHPRPRRTRRLVLATAGGVAASATAAVVVVVSVGTQSAFAGWSAAPTTPAGDQTSAALASCRAAPPIPGPPNGSAPAPPQLPTDVAPSLTDTRGPYTLMLFDDGEANALCIIGPSLRVLSVAGASGQASFGYDSVSSGGGGPAPGGVTTHTGGSSSIAGPDGIHQFALSASSAGANFSVADGRIAGDVTGATVVLADGSQVAATTGNGWFLAWWPNTQRAVSLVLITSSGVSTQTSSSAASVTQTSSSAASTTQTGSGGSSTPSLGTP